MITRPPATADWMPTATPAYAGSPSGMVAHIFHRCATLFALAGLCARGRAGFDIETPAVTLSTADLRLVARVGEVVPERTITLANAYDIQYAWRAVVSAPWLTVDPLSGSSGAAPIRVRVSTRGLAPGTRQAGATFVVTSTTKEVGSLGLVVELQLGAPGWTELQGPSCGDVYALAGEDAIK